jgi:hypothetical protein
MIREITGLKSGSFKDLKPKVHQANALDVWYDDIDGLTCDVETLFGLDLEEMGTHEGKDGNAVVKNVFGICRRRLCQD